MEKLEIASLKAESGTKAIGKLKVSEFPDGSPVDIPVILINGVEKGKLLYVGAGIHGDELTGIDICRLLSKEVDPLQLKGSIVILPILNPLGFRIRERNNVFDMLYDNIELVFPGTLEGSPSQILAYHLYHDVISKADFVMDLHTGPSGGTCVPYAIPPPETGNGCGDISLEAAKVFGADIVLIDSRWWEDGPDIIRPKDYTGKILAKTLPVVCAEDGIPGICVELGEGNRLDDYYVQWGLTGVKNVMKHLGMIKGSIQKQGKNLVCNQRFHVRPKRGGLLHIAVKLGDQVKKGDLLAKVITPLDESEDLIAPVSGIVMRIQKVATVVPGDRAVSIGVPAAK